ncbi:MAG: dihydropteroate synthase [Nitrospinae bacterium]|nr:dihydropteroate synthase [Nitrospinota bacterium]
MGILNVTPDSFSDGGMFISVEEAVARAGALVAEGADILDVGGESSRPGSDPVPAQVEAERVVPVIRMIVKRHPKIPVSIDTRKPEVAGQALAAGAAMINDISGMRDGRMIQIAAKSQAPVVVTHMKGEPKTMQKRPVYRDVAGEILRYFRERTSVLKKSGIHKIILDPGIGFGKTVSHNFAILNGLEKFAALGYPLMVGASRKSFIGAALGEPVDRREAATAAITAVCVMKGASIVRVHNVMDNRHAAIVAERIRKGK